MHLYIKKTLISRNIINRATVIDQNGVALLLYMYLLFVIWGCAYLYCAVVSSRSYCVLISFQISVILSSLTFIWNLILIFCSVKYFIRPLQFVIKYSENKVGKVVFFLYTEWFIKISILMRMLLRLCISISSVLLHWICYIFPWKWTWVWCDKPLELKCVLNQTKHTALQTIAAILNIYLIQVASSASIWRRKTRWFWKTCLSIGAYTHTCCVGTSSTVWIEIYSAFQTFRQSCFSRFI